MDQERQVIALFEISESLESLRLQELDIHGRHLLKELNHTPQCKAMIGNGFLVAWVAFLWRWDGGDTNQAVNGASLNE